MTSPHDSALQREHSVGFHATVESAPVGIAHFAADGRFLFCNDKLCEILGYSDAELMQRSFIEITHPDDLPECLRLTSELADGLRTSYRHEKRFVRADGSAVWVCVTASAVRDAQGAVSYCIGIAEDISERRAAAEAQQEAEVRLRAALAASERARRLREEVLAVVAHDLRNPVQTIVMSAGSITDLPLGEEQRLRQLEIIKRSAWRMEHLISDLLDISRMEAGTFAIRHSRINVADVLHETAELFDGQASAHGITLETDIPPRIPPINGDQHRLSQALSNLVGNAIKATAPGGVITLAARQDELEVVLSVIDTGSGIAEADLPKVFERFWQADRVSGGAGLGLVIAKGLVDAHGGTISVESTIGRGTSFHVRLPLASRDRRRAAAES